MSSTYTKVFTNPYPGGWENLPSIRTPIIAQALQQHTNAIINIENYLGGVSIPQKTSDLINDAIIVPTKLSQLQNDVGYLTGVSLPSKLSEFENDAGYLTQDELVLPDKLSDFANDMGFITNIVNSLLYYYTKAESYNKAEINQLLRNIKSFNIEVVAELPTANISDSTIYCIPKTADDTVIVVSDDLNLEDDVASDIGYFLDMGSGVTSEEEVEDPFNG